MKKILILMLCAVIFCSFSIVASADEVDTTEETEVITPEEEAPPAEEVPEEPKMTLPEKIVNFITTNYDSTALISLVITIIAYAIYGLKQYKSLGGKIGVLNNNAVNIAEKSTQAIDASFVEVKGIAEKSVDTVNKALGEAKEIMQAISDGNTAALTETLGKAETIAATVVSFKEVMETFLERIGDIESDKVATREALLKACNTMEACKKASIEEGNIVAELLMLANIPNSKKEEIYARHLSAVNAIAETEKSEVATDDGKET
jgi:hypothetical protein